MKLKILSAVVFLLVCTSCLNVSLHAIGAYNTKAEPTAYTNNKKTIVFIPMRHIGLKEFYDDVHRLTDSLHNEGYIVFYESVKIRDSFTDEQKKIMDLKLRKMVGVSIDTIGYLDTVNNRLMGRRFKNRKGLMNQPKYTLMGADLTKDRVQDVPVNELIAEYESRYGEIRLNPCDYNLRPDEKYECGKEPDDQVNAIIRGYRDESLAKAIMEEKNDKIVLVFGALHEWGVYKKLQTLDSTWVRVIKQHN
ncbi:hypothetical protein [Flavobacterium sp.]|uniref:hypothetical protein n=1 Tax=Flavobacterium sp. TaxID=239 RepID=UPI0026377C0B|nr:hypothetical protein [Flavobacterium sp.]